METSVARYYHDIRKSKPVSYSEEKKMNAEELISANLKFVVSEARKFQGRGLDLEDLIQEGNMGLVEAAEKYDSSLGFKFISFAVHYIRMRIQLALSKQTAVRMPLNQISSLSRINKITSEMLEKEGRKPTEAELSKETGLPVSQIRILLRASRKAVSIDTPIGNGDDEDGGTLEDIIKNDHSPRPDNWIDGESLSSDIKRIFNVLLTDKEKDVISKIYGIGTEEKTEEDIAKEYKVSNERIRQIREGALKKLRKNSNVRTLLMEYLA